MQHLTMTCLTMKCLTKKLLTAATKKLQRLGLVAGVLVISVSANAQAADQNKMMAQMMEMQQCFQSIDQSEINALQQRALELQHIIKSLCSKGQDSKATQQAIAFGTEIAQSQTVKKIRQCTEKIPDMMKNMPNPMAAYDEYDRDFTDVSICEEM